jgi:hypothetical protein
MSIVIWAHSVCDMACLQSGVPFTSMVVGVGVRAVDVDKAVVDGRVMRDGVSRESHVVHHLLGE